MRRPILLIPLAAVLLVGLPLAGVVLAGRAPGPYLAFPPQTSPAGHASFSWTAFVPIALLVIACVAPFVTRIVTHTPAATPPRAQRALPWWGWLGAALLVASWVVAWNRFQWAMPWQRHTFTPIWLGYILTINALAWRRTGRCMLRDEPGRLLALFPLSAVFWWFFEYLNRFVENWFYVGGAPLTASQYFWQATLPFSTVLPAVLSTHQLLASFPRLQAGLASAWRIRAPRPRFVALITLLVSAAALAGVGIWPRALYPMVWVAPLLVLLSLQSLWRAPTILAPLARGDWRDLWLAALAALACGALWELWNARSLAQWQYAIPYVHRFQIFEMPLLGYAGYLPFGLQCLAVGRLLQRVPGACSRAPGHGSGDHRN